MGEGPGLSLDAVTFAIAADEQPGGMIVHDRPTIRSARVRLLADGPPAGPSRGHTYEPLVVGPAILQRRPGGPGPWLVEVTCDRRFLPRAPRTAALLARTLEQLGGLGLACRVGVAIAGPQDLMLHGRGRRIRFPDRHASTPSAAGMPSEIYGWALMYQASGRRGLAFVDADERFDDLPACFELPGELLDRAAHLEARGIRTRPLAMVTRPDDFARTDDGRWRSRFHPCARLHRACGLDRLV